MYTYIHMFIYISNMYKLMYLVQVILCRWYVFTLVNMLGFWHVMEGHSCFLLATSKQDGVTPQALCKGAL